MKTILTIALTLIIALPAFTYALVGWENPLKQYEGIYIEYRNNGDVIKVYDHEENVVCYLHVYNTGGAISCVKD